MTSCRGHSVQVFVKKKKKKKPALYENDKREAFGERRCGVCARDVCSKEHMSVRRTRVKVLVPGVPVLVVIDSAMPHFTPVPPPRNPAIGYCNAFYANDLNQIFLRRRAP